MAAGAIGGFRERLAVGDGLGRWPGRVRSAGERGAQKQDREELFALRNIVPAPMVSSRRRYSA